MTKQRVKTTKIYKRLREFELNLLIGIRYTRKDLKI